MKKIIKLTLLLVSTSLFSQVGHLMQGVGAVNMSMGGASTAQPISISGALQWNPAAISTFNGTIINFDIGRFSGSPELSSSLPSGMLGSGSPATTGTTKDDKNASPMPAIAIVWGKPESKHTFGASIFGVSGFGTDFAQETNLPIDALGNPNPNWDPNNSNAILYPQNLRGFGHVSSNYALLQVGLTWAYELSDKFSIGVEPTFNYGTLEIAPNPLGNPTATGYANSDKATTTGFGAQFGLFYDSGKGIKLGASYKTGISLSDLDHKNTYLDGTTGTSSFNMDFPAILSLGLGYSNDIIDLALDYRMIDYENTDGFADTGWTSNATIKGYGWKNVNVISAGLQYKKIDKLPIRVGYTYSSNPIDEDVAFYSISAPAVIKNAFQLGMGYEVNDNFNLNAVYHYGTSGGKTEGKMLNPMAITPSTPYGSVDGTSVSYEMTTNLIMIGVSYTFNKKEKTAK